MTADDRLALIRRKSERAEKHFGELQAELGAFLDCKPYKVGAQRDPQTRKPVYYLVGVDETPSTLPLIIGDVLQCLRATVDHLAYQLLLVADTGGMPDRVRFPVGRDLPAFKSALGQIKDYLRSSALDAISAVEPYPGGKGALLWTLHDLNNIDKHRVVLTTFVRKGGVDVSLLPQGLDLPDWVRNAWANAPPIFIREVGPAPQANVGDVLYIGAVDDEIEENRKFSFDVAFAEPGVVEGSPILPTLHELRDLVTGIVTAFWRGGHLT